MIIITIKELEKNLGFKIKKNIFCLAIDTATVSGVAKMKIDSKKVKIEFGIFKVPSAPKECEDNSEKYEEFMNMLVIMTRDFRKTLENKKPNTMLVLENSFLGMSPATYGFLKGFMGVLYATLFDNFEKIKLFYPTQARKMAGFKSKIGRITLYSDIKERSKEQEKEIRQAKTQSRKDKKQEIVDFVNNILKSDVQDDNCADAIVLALAGIKE
jgi:Holliday junction resolvasome RuvABC endonuclease subunit